MTNCFKAQKVKWCPCRGWSTKSAQSLADLPVWNAHCRGEATDLVGSTLSSEFTDLKSMGHLIAHQSLGSKQPTGSMKPSEHSTHIRRPHPRSDLSSAALEEVKQQKPAEGLDKEAKSGSEFVKASTKRVL